MQGVRRRLHRDCQAPCPGRVTGTGAATKGIIHGCREAGGGKKARAEEERRRVLKTELRHKPHAVLKDVTVIEIWHDGQFIGTIAGADGSGVRIIPKPPMTAKPV